MTITDRPTLDLLAGDFYVDDPYTTYTWLRANEPIYWDDINELWGVSTYDAIVEIEKNKSVFISSDTLKGGYRPNMPADRSIIGLDDPEHTKRRMLVARRFTPRAVSGWEPHIRTAVTKLLDAAAERGTAELITQLAGPLPAMMIGSLLGFPDDAWPNLMDWSERTIAMGGGPRYYNEDGLNAVFEFTAACIALYEEKKLNPTDSVMKTWIDAEQSGLGDYAFSIDEIVSDCLLLLDGGAETTRTVIARTLLNLIDNPAEFAKLKAGADLTVATEEFIRYVTPIHNMCRVATRDYDIGGVTVKKGDQVVLMYSSANRDENYFSNGDQLDVTRSPNHHLSFGFGTHFCLGASLARLEITIFFEEFLKRFSSISRTPSTPHVEMPNSFVFGLKEAHVTLA